MLSEFQQSKIEKLFWFWDADANGFLERADFSLVGEKLSEERSWRKGLEAYNFLMQRLMEYYDEAEKFADVNKDNKISLSEWLTFCDTFIHDKEMYQTTVTNFAQAVFDACDIDDNGVLERGEFELLFRVYGKTNKHADLAYDLITVQNSIPLTKERLLALLDDFFLSEDQMKLGNYFFGPLK